MNIAEAVAFCALMLGLICFAGIMLDGYGRRLKSRERELELRVRLAEVDMESRAAGLPEVEERLRVLERIATDGDGQLASEIEALRNHAPVREAVQ